MGLLLTTIAAGSIWVILIALGRKPFDALLLAILLILLAATAQIFGKYLPGRRRERGDDSGYIPR